VESGSLESRWSNSKESLLLSSPRAGTPTARAMTYRPLSIKYNAEIERLGRLEQEFTTAAKRELQISTAFFNIDEARRQNDYRPAGRLSLRVIV
jgi:hypothetical protein